MTDADVIRLGTDSSGRPILVTEFMARWLDGLERHLGWRPTIVQGAFMTRAGGGVPDSSGFHNYGGCLDLRTWDRTDQECQDLIRACRLGGAGAWLRYPSQGFDFHCHLVLGADPGIGSLASMQFRNYLAGDAGLDGPGADYHWRPSPMVTTPPADYLTEKDWFDMATENDLKRIVEAALDRPEFIDKVAAKVQKAVWDRGLIVTKADKTETTKTTRSLLRELWQKSL